MVSDQPERPPASGRGSDPELGLDVALLLRRPGDSTDVVVDLVFEDLANSVVRAPHVEGNLVVESMSDSLSVTGTLVAAWRGPCRRCLDEAQGRTETDVHEVYERRPSDGETYLLVGDTVDLAPMIREQMLLSLPLAPLCGHDCAGPDPDRFGSLAPRETDPVDDIAPSGDPRWAALDALRFDAD